MGTIYIPAVFRSGGALFDPTSVALADPTGTYGVKRTDTGGIVVAAGVAMVRQGAGTYNYPIVEPAPGLTYQYVVQSVIEGRTLYSGELTYSPADATVPVTMTVVYGRALAQGNIVLGAGGAAAVQFIINEANGGGAYEVGGRTMRLTAATFDPAETVVAEWEGVAGAGNVVTAVFAAGAINAQMQLKWTLIDVTGGGARVAWGWMYSGAMALGS